MSLIEIHVLQNFAPSNLNRDDTGAPKDAVFGGSRRARISSQCLKRAVRTHFRDAVQAGGLTPDDLGVRTKRVHEILTELLVSRGRDAAAAGTAVRRALATQELEIKDDAKSQYLLFLGNREVEQLASAIDAHWDLFSAEPDAGAGEEKKKGGKTKKAAAGAADPAVRATIAKIFDGGKAVDIALFGRMLTDMPEKNQYAACQVAHAISTHAVEREFDFYTAVDDRKPEDTAGADMMGTVEFNSACFYRYAVLDWRKLTANLQNDAVLANKAARVFLEGFIVAEPTGKQNSFAAHNPPEFVAIVVQQSGAPLNLANAFEQPISYRTAGILTQESANRLVRKGNALRTTYGFKGNTCVLNPVGADVGDFGTTVTSLSALLDRALASLLA